MKRVHYIGGVEWTNARGWLHVTYDPGRACTGETAMAKGKTGVKPTQLEVRHNRFRPIEKP